MRPWWHIAPEGPTPEQISEAATILREGGVALLPTDTVYGLHANALDPKTVGQIYRIKAREPEKALPVLHSDFDQLDRTGVVSSPSVRAILESIWPAPLTAVLPLREPIAASMGTVTLAVRIPDLKWLRSLVAITGPLASTSANLSGEPPIRDPSELDQATLEWLSLVVDQGVIEAKASTVVDFTGSSPEILREGAFPFTQNLWKTMWKTL